MPKPNLLTKCLGIAGTIIVWVPIVAPAAFALISLASGEGFRFDYLMPAEAFPVLLAGWVLLMWAAVRARSQRGLIGWSMLAGVLLLVGGQAIAVVTGLASGEIEPVGLPWAAVLASLALYCLAIVAIGVGGVRLLRQLFRHPAGDALPSGNA